MSAYVLGIRPGKQGYETLHFEPYGGFEELKGVVPTAKGLVAVKGETISGKKRYTLCVPGTMEIEMVLPDGAEGEIVRYE